MNMTIDSRLVEAYLSGENMDDFREAWFFAASSVSADLGKNVFTLPPNDSHTKASVSKLENRIRSFAKAFVPVNQAIWDALFPDWENIEAQIDLIVGFPEPYDAVTDYATNGQVHIIFDLIHWLDYADGDDLDKTIRNLLTHEITHLFIGKYRVGIDDALQSEDYITRMDAVTFHEGFAHLISYETEEIDSVDWHSASLEKAYANGKEKMHKALSETDPEKQEKCLYDAACGNYYDKYACMCGMLYLAGCWEKNGIDGLKNAFSDYHGFAKKTISD